MPAGGAPAQAVALGAAARARTQKQMRVVECVAEGGRRGRGMFGPVQTAYQDRTHHNRCPYEVCRTHDDAE